MKRNYKLPASLFKENTMRKTTLAFTGALLLITGLSACVAGPYPYAPAPYYGGVAPYYGTTFVPGYAYGWGGGWRPGGYYPYHRSVNIYSRYNNNYWHSQRNVQQRAASSAAAPHEGGWHR
jgi:hypothetical protein